MHEVEWGVSESRAIIINKTDRVCRVWYVNTEDAAGCTK